MPLIQKIVQVGDSRAVIIPSTWLSYYERKTGKRLREVTLEVNGKITIQPLNFLTDDNLVETSESTHSKKEEVIP